MPYNWLVDATRQSYGACTFRSPAEFIEDMRWSYRESPWEDATSFVQMWCESRSLAGVIKQDCYDLGVTLFPCGGFSSLTFTYEAAQTILARYRERPVVCFYLGDYDASGTMIDLSAEKAIRQHLPEGLFLEFRRIGINADQIELYDLPTKPPKPGEKRAPHIQATVEAEAMPAHIMRQLLRDAVGSLLPDGALEAAKDKEHHARQRLGDIAARMEAGEI